MIGEGAYFFKRKAFILPLALALLLSFGYSATHIAQGIDDLCRVAYTDGGTFIGTGRIFGWLTMMLLGHDGQETFLQVLVGTAFLGLGAVLFSMVFRRAANDKIPLMAYTVFACLLVSFPLNAEAYVYADTGFMNRLSYALVPLSLLFMDDWFEKGGHWRLALAVFCAAWGVGMFESAAVVFTCGTGAYLTLRQLYGPVSGPEIGAKARARDFFYRGILLAGILIGGILFCKILSAAAIKVFSIRPWIQPSQTVQWLSGELALAQRAENLIKRLFIKYCILGLFSLPLGMICLSWLLGLILSVVAVVKKRGLVVLSLLVMGLSPVLLSLIGGQFAPYRTCLGAAPFVGFMALLALTSLFHGKGLLKKLYLPAISIMLIIALFQCYDLNNLFRADYENYRQELSMLENVHRRLQEGFAVDEKPVIFYSEGWYGNYSERTIRYRQVDTSNRLYKALYNRMRFLPELTDIYVLPNPNLFWAIGIDRYFPNAYPQRELERYLHLLGHYDLIMPDEDALAAYRAQGKPENSPYPAKDCIVDCGEYIFINLG